MSMPDTHRQFTMFVASPGDVTEERRLLEDAVSRVNARTRDGLGLIISVRRWEDLPPLTPDAIDQSAEDRILEEVDRSDLFVAILFKRYGTRDPGQTKSRTEIEIDAMLSRWRKQPRLKLLFYFRDVEPNADQGPQEVQVLKLRQRLDSLGVLHCSYRSPQEFKERFTHDAYDLLMRMQASTYKRSMLRRFWCFGGDDSRPHDTQLAIMYPPTERQQFVAGASSDFWLRRLTTQLAFEDYKAIQKIEKTVRLIGFNSYRVFASTSPPPELPRMNRAWLCLCRNRDALRHLGKHRERRFEFRAASKSAPSRRPNTIEWRTTSGANVHVRSPMARYLELQRRRMSSHADWVPELARVVARDYAVLARLTDHVVPQGDDSPVRDYFFGGLRGLGTWGSAWYVDRMYKAFGSISPDENIERLLEVTYFNGRIVEVKDVSECSQEYFDLQMRVSEMRATIAQIGQLNSAS